MSTTKTMGGDAYLSAVLHGMHVSASGAASAAHVAFGSDAAATCALRDLSQLLLALHDGVSDEAEARVRKGIAAQRAARSES
mgnify:CR=1 FL=1